MVQFLSFTFQEILINERIPLHKDNQNVKYVVNSNISKNYESLLSGNKCKDETQFFEGKFNKVITISSDDYSAVNASNKDWRI